MLLTEDLFDTEHSRFGKLLRRYRYPWQLLPELGDQLLRLGEQLPTDRFEQVAEAVWIARTATVATSAEIVGPCVIDEGTVIRAGALVRGRVLVGCGAVVGNSTELKNAILFDGVQVPHYNYIGDSIIGYRAHFGAGAVTSNVKGDRSPVVIRDGEQRLETGLKKCGALVGDGTEIGCGCVLNPGTVVGRNAQIYPLCSVRGLVPPGYIYKAADNVVKRRGGDGTTVRD